MRSLSNLPPGVTDRMIDEAFGADEQCAVCKCGIEDCVCPECLVCKEAGNPACYKPGPLHLVFLRLNKTQLMSRSKAKIAELQERIQDEGYYQAWLADQPEDFSEVAPKILE